MPPCDFCGQRIPEMRGKCAKFCSALCRTRFWERKRTRKPRPHGWRSDDLDISAAEIDAKFEAARAEKQRQKWSAA